MKKIFIFSLCITLASIFFFSCKKGPQDPFISFASRESRVVGNWKVTAWTVNDTDQLVRATHVWTAAPSPCNFSIVTTTDTKDMELSFDKNGNYTQVYTNTLTVENSFSGSGATCIPPANPNPVITGYTRKGKWLFSGGTEGIKWKQGLSILDEYSNQTVNYNILELKSKEMKLEQWFVDPLTGGLAKAEYTLTLQ